MTTGMTHSQPDAELVRPPPWAVRYLTLAHAAQREFYATTMTRVMSYLHKISMTEWKNMPRPHNNPGFVALIRYLNGPSWDFWFYTNPVAPVTSARPPREPNPYVEEEPGDPSENSPKTLRSTEFTLLMYFADTQLDPTNAYNLRARLRHVLALLLVYDDAKLFGDARGLFKEKK